MKTPIDAGPEASLRAQELFENELNVIHRHTDKFFANLMVLQWLGGIGAALIITPNTWIGAGSQSHWHVWAAIFLGGAMTGLTVFLAWKMPGRRLTRHTIAVVQIGFSGLFIHLSGGRIETHFHIFGSLAFLAVYRDWKVLVTATFVVTVDHLVRGWMLPQSIFGMFTPSPWRSLEHLGWVLFEVSFLIIAIRSTLREMFQTATRRATLEATNLLFERQVEEQMLELTASHVKLEGSEEQFSSAFRYAAIGMALVSPTGRWLKVNQSLCNLLGYPPSELYEKTFQDITYPDDLEKDLSLLRQMLAGEIQSYQMEKRYLHKAGHLVWVSLSVSLVWDAGGQPLHLISQLQNIAHRKETEAQLENAYRELLEVSRQAGMAEVATSVLHNVGNVLNSVNVSCAVVADRVRKSRIDRVEKTADLLNLHANDLAGFFTADSSGKKLPDFLARLASQLSTEQAEILQELQSLAKNIHHIKDIVAMQQNYAKFSGVTESVAVSDLLEDSLSMNEESRQRPTGRVIREYGEVTRIMVEKHKALQILVNLIRNAKHACDHMATADRRITVRVIRCAESVRLSVIDNGVGIPPENLTRIFSHGFTTKRNGHGFGLHNGALAAREMGGSLTVHSGGVGRGATFTLELPLDAGGNP